MKNLVVLSALGLVVSAVSAHAADLGRRPAPAPVMVAPAYNWSGFYFGGHAGAGWGSHDGSAVSVVGTGTTASSGVVGSQSDVGFVGGIQGGFNYALSPSWMLGVEGDISWTEIGTNQSSGLVTAGGVGIPGTGVTFTRDVNWLASVRGRLGYTWDRVMVYGTGGAAWADYDGSAFATIATGAIAGGNVANKTRSGWVAGGGIEWAIPSFMFAGDWTARIEYLHYDFSTDSPTAAFAPGPGTATFSFGDPTVDVVRVGLNYKFGMR